MNQLSQKLSLLLKDKQKNKKFNNIITQKSSINKIIQQNFQSQFQIDIKERLNHQNQNKLKSKNNKKRQTIQIQDKLNYSGRIIQNININIFDVNITQVKKQRNPLEQKLKKLKSRSYSQRKLSVLQSQKVQKTLEASQSSKKPILLRSLSSLRPMSSSKKRVQQISVNKGQNMISMSINQLSSKKQIQNKLTQKKSEKSYAQQRRIMESGINSGLMLFVKNFKFQNNLDFKRFQQITQHKRLTNVFIAHNIDKIVNSLQSIILKYKINTAIVDVNQIWKLQTKSVFSNYQIIKLMTSYRTILQSHPQIPGIKYFYTDIEKGKHLASSRIISFFKMLKYKKQIQNYRSLLKKIKLIQSYWRLSLQIKRHRQNVLKLSQHKLITTKKLQEKFVNNWNIIKTSKKLELHVCSLAFQQFKRLTMENRQQIENIQLSRIFRALESTDLQVVYVTPIQISQQIYNYYQRLFRIVTKNESFSLADRVTFIYPQNSQRLSKVCELGTLSCLLYSPKCLKRIKHIIKCSSVQQSSYILPSYPSIQYVQLSFILNLPIYSSSQPLCKILSTKSGFKQIINPIIQKQSNKIFRLLKSVDCVFSQKELINMLGLLVFRNQQVKRWYFKIDDQHTTRGLAYFNVASVKILKDINDQANNQLLNNMFIDQKQIIKIIVQQLSTKLKKILKILHKSIYPTYTQYITHFLTRGGVIQQCAPQPYISSSISFVIQPNGDFQILGTYKKLELNSKSILQAMQTPSMGILTNQIEKIVRTLYRRIYLKMKMFGYFAVDFIVSTPKHKLQNLNHNNNINHQQQYRSHQQQVHSHHQPNHNSHNKQIFVIGIDCFYNSYTSAIMMIKQLTKVNYNKDCNTFVRMTDLSNYDNISIESSRISKQNMISEQENNQKSLGIISKNVSINTQKNEQKPLETLQYIYCPKITLPNLQNIKIFFKKCKFQNIAFDIKRLYGTVFLPIDDLECENIGFLSSQINQTKLYQQILKVIEFFIQNYRTNIVKKQLKKHNKINGHFKKENDQIGMLRGVLLADIHKYDNQKSNHSNQQSNINHIALQFL